ncbi:MAG: glycerol-3-phosphate 1-O-acyltransferase PlsY [Anaerovoracaceae bacterium]
MYPIETLGASPFTIICMVVLAYFIGNISPSTILAKANGIDIKSAGSGNAGTTNALRVLGKKAAIITLIVDVLKGTIAVLLGHYVGGHFTAMLCVVGVFCGHIWPIIYKFKGGKGVATAFGSLVGLNVAMGFTALLIVIIGVLVTKRMSAGSVLGAATFPIIAWIFEPGFIYLGTVLAMLVLVKHRANIKRLINGEEPKLNFKKKERTS